MSALRRTRLRPTILSTDSWTTSTSSAGSSVSTSRGWATSSGSRGRAVRPRLHRRRSALLAAVGPPLGAGRGGAPAAGRTPVHPRGPSDAVGGRRSAAGRPAGGRLPLFRAGGADPRGGERYQRPDAGNLPPFHHPRVEPRPWGSGTA